MCFDTFLSHNSSTSKSSHLSTFFFLITYHFHQFLLSQWFDTR